MKESLFYRCEHCGNIVVLLKSGGGSLTCCGHAMTKLAENSIDASKEKHVPVAEKEGSKIKIAVGSVAHPMTPEHYIEWIALVTDDKVEIEFLKPGMKPKTEFVYNFNQEDLLVTDNDDEIVPNCEGQPCNFVFNEISTNKVMVYAYCNLHGLWKTEL